MRSSEDKLPPIGSVSSHELPRRRRAGSNRSRTSISRWSLSPSNAHRMDISRSAHGHKGRQSRFNTQFLSHNNSLTIASMAHKRPSYEVKRFVSNAAIRSRSMFDRFVEQLKTYHSFQPFFVDGGVYNLPKSSRHFKGPTAWDAVGRVLDTSASHTLRHNANERFLAAPELAAHSETDLAFFSFTGSSSWNVCSTATPNDKHRVSFDLIRREKPEMTSEELRQEQLFWDRERVNHERVLRGKTYSEQQEELHGLLSGSVEDKTRWKCMLSMRKENDVEVTFSSVESVSSQLEQKLLWDAFHSSDVLPIFCGTAVNAAEIIYNYKESGEVHKWIHSEWKNHTDKHENAALSIQCAYRCHRAKIIAARVRYVRQIAFNELLVVEKNSMQTWATAVSLMNDEISHGDENFNSTLRSMKFVLCKLEAMAMKRRAQRKAKEKQDMEVRQYAALTIQRIYRGHCGREVAETIRHPELLVARCQARMRRAAIVLQAVWRGRTVRLEIKRKKNAVVVIQQLVRQSAARKSLRRLRERCRKVLECSSREFAARRVVLFLKKCVSRHRAYIKERWEQVQTLRRVANGYFARMTVRKRQQCTFGMELQVSLWMQRQLHGLCGRAMARRQRDIRDMLFLQWRREDAAQVIQRTWIRTRALLRGATKTGERSKGRPDRKPASGYSAEDAVLMIQRWWRSMFLVRRGRKDRDAEQKQILLLEAAERILRFYRTFKLRRL